MSILTRSRPAACEVERAPCDVDVDIPGFATYLGIDPQTEPQLVWIAERCSVRGLHLTLTPCRPPGIVWTPGRRGCLFVQRRGQGYCAVPRVRGEARVTARTVGLSRLRQLVP